MGFVAKLVLSHSEEDKCKVPVFRGCLDPCGEHLLPTTSAWLSSVLLPAQSPHSVSALGMVFNTGNVQKFPETAPFWGAGTERAQPSPPRRAGNGSGSGSRGGL